MHLSHLLVQIAAILLLARLLTRALRLIGQPSVIAEIVAGIALGPSILGLVWPSGMTALFPAESMAGLGLVANLGLVFFMFLVGLEFDPKLLQGQARSSIAISNAGIVVPFLLGMATAIPLHADLAPEGVAQLPFSLFLGTAMSVTAFPVLARILTERRLVRTRVGAIALAAAAVDDVTAWCLLALVVGIAEAGGLKAALITTVMALAYSGAVWAFLRPGLARIGPRAGAAVSTDVIAAVILLLVVSASITEWIGIHALFGSFLIGAAMPRKGGVAGVVAEKMEDFVTVVLLPLFFAYSGLRTEIGLLSSAEDWALCLLLILVASVGKFGGTSIVARLTGLPFRESAAVGILMNTRGLMELVVLNMGLDLGIISPRLFAMMVVMAIVTTWITSPLLRWLYPASQALADSPPPAPTPAQTATPAGGLLLCVSDPAIAASLTRIAAAWGPAPGAQVLALHLRPIDRPHDYLRQEETSEETPLDAVTRSANKLGLQVQPLSFPSGDPAEDIVRIATLKEVDLLLMGIHRSTLGWDTLGGVTGRVLRGCPGDVAVLVDHGLGALRRIALRPGKGPTGEAARRIAARLAQGTGAVVVEGEDATADLVVTGWVPGASLPPQGGPSWLIVRDRQLRTVAPTAEDEG